MCDGRFAIFYKICCTHTPQTDSFRPSLSLNDKRFGGSLTNLLLKQGKKL